MTLATQPVAGVSAETVEAVRAALASQATVANGDPALLAQATTQGISTATGIVGINLEAPSKKLFPVLSPLRNRFPRIAAAMGATAVQWRAITAINAANTKAGVGEGLRNSVVSTTEVDKSQAYKSFGLDDSVTFEAQWAGRGFEDVRAMATSNLLSATMVEEEKIILGGNVGAIGKPASLTAATSTATGGSLSNGTAYDFAVSALTLYGYLNGAQGNDGSADADDETDGRTGTATTGAGDEAIQLSWPAVRGAVAYNVYGSADGGTPFYIATVTDCKYTVLSVPGSGNVANTADQTADALSFDGVIPQIQAAASGAYFADLEGAALTGDNAGGIVEIDEMLKSLWDEARIGPTVILVNAQEAMNMLTKIAANGSTTTFRLSMSVGADGRVSGGMRLGSYLNKFTQQDIPIEIHPYLAPGTILALSERLPFPNNNVPNPFVVDVRAEYAQYDWALVQRKWEFGVYASECLKVYFPAGCGSIVGIGNG